MLQGSLVSIITPSYNSERFISFTIESVLSQRYQNWEMLIVDDGSNDNSVEIIKKYIHKDSRIKLFQNEKNLGPAKSRNKAIKESSGRYIAFLDSDDVWFPDKLEKQISFMEIGSIALSYTEYYKIDEAGNVISSTIEVPEKVDYKKLLKSNYIPNLTAIYDVKYLGKVYMPDILKRQDYALWFKILKKIDFAYAINEPLAYYRIRKDGSVSSNKFKAVGYTWKIYREVEKLSLWQSIYSFVNYAIISYIKHKK